MSLQVSKPHNQGYYYGHQQWRTPGDKFALANLVRRSSYREDMLSDHALCFEYAIPDFVVVLCAQIDHQY
jgi:hypothetical protein